MRVWVDENRLRRRILVLHFAAALLIIAISVGFSDPAGAAQMHHAGVVVRHGNGGLTFSYVAFVEDQISGAELLKRANLNAVTIAFGGLGEGVCMIEREGCPPSVCQKKMCQNGGSDSSFWHFYQLDQSGQWRLMSLGASSTNVRDGDVSGWSWTGADPNLPAITFPKLQTLSAQHAGEDGTALIWRTGPAPAAESAQPWSAYLGAGALLVVAAGSACWIIARKRRPVLPGENGDE